MNIKIYFVQFFRLASHTLGQALLSDIILMVQLYRSFFLSFSVVAPLCSVEVHLLYIWIKRKICSYPPLPLFWLKQNESSCFFRGNMNPLLLCLILLGRQNRLWNEQSGFRLILVETGPCWHSMNAWWKNDTLTAMSIDFTEKLK